MPAQIRISNLRFEHHPNGLGVPTAKPRLSWNIAPDGPEIPQGWQQKSYEVEVKLQNAKETESYDIKGNNTILVPWPATPLVSLQSASVRVRSLGISKDGDADTPWSEWATVEAALLDGKQWTAKTISSNERKERTDTKHPDENGNRPIRFRRNFEAPGNLHRCRLYITALGVYNAFLNGQRIGDECLAPGWTAYQHRIQFQVLDVSSLIQPGTNTLLVEVGEGWYSGRLTWHGGVSNAYGKDISLLAQLRGFDNAESFEPSFELDTDSSWESCLSPVVASSLYDGEAYDLRLERDEGSSDAAWIPVRVLETPEVEFVASSCPPIRIVEHVKPTSISKDPEGKVLIDFGQNLVGWVRIHRLVKPDGHRLQLRFAEVLEHGRLGTRPLRDAKATDTIIFGGGGSIENWAPQFTFHGFRYVEITGWLPEDESPLTLNSLTAEVICTDMKRTGYFSCSDSKINQLHNNVVWSMKGNFVGLPTDCPQRDERLGWTGDIQVFTPTASFLYDCEGMLANWMRDLVLEQKQDHGIVPVVVPNILRHVVNAPFPGGQAVWDDVVVLTPWNLYHAFGDIEVLKESWQGMKDHLAALPRGEDGLWNPDVWQLGDWLDPNAPPAEPGLARTDGTLVADEYLVHVTNIVSKIAAVLDLEHDKIKFAADHARLKQAFSDKYMAKSGLVVGDSQTALSLALMFDLHENDQQRKVAAERLNRLVRLAKFKVSTGFSGTPVVLHALTKGGHLNIAYRMILEEKNPSWLYPVSMGATTIWERWDSMLEDGSINPGEMTSFNHYALGSVANWLHSTVGGLSPLEPGWKRFLVRPQPGGTISSAEVTYHSQNGVVGCSWNMDGKRHLKAKITVAPNTRAVVEKPNGTSEELESGQHEVEWDVPEDEEAWPPNPILTG